MLSPVQHPLLLDPTVYLRGLSFFTLPTLTVTLTKPFSLDTAKEHVV